MRFHFFFPSFLSWNQEHFQRRIYCRKKTAKSKRERERKIFFFFCQKDLILAVRLVTFEINPLKKNVKKMRRAFFSKHACMWRGESRSYAVKQKKKGGGGGVGAAVP